MRKKLMYNVVHERSIITCVGMDVGLNSLREQKNT